MGVSLSYITCRAIHNMHWHFLQKDRGEIEDNEIAEGPTMLDMVPRGGAAPSGGQLHGALRRLDAAMAPIGEGTHTNPRWSTSQQPGIPTPEQREPNNTT